MVLSKELEAILELRRRKSEDDCIECNAVLPTSDDEPDDNDCKPAACGARTLEDPSTVAGAIDKELKYKLEMRRQKSEEMLLTEGHLTRHNAEIGCWKEERGQISSTKVSSGLTSLAGFKSAKKDAGIGINRPTSHSIRRLYHGADKEIHIESDRRQPQRINPATSAPTTFPFPRSSPRASSPTNSDESSAYPSNITSNVSYEPIKPFGTKSFIKTEPTLTHMLSLKQKILQASIAIQPVIAADYSSADLVPSTDKSMADSLHNMESEQYNKSSNNQSHEQNTIARNTSYAETPDDFRQEECFSGHSLHVSSSVINDQKGSDIIEETWGEKAELSHVETQSAFTDFFSSPQFQGNFSLPQQQQNWNAEDSRNIQQEIDFFSSSSIDDDGSNPIAKTIDSSIFFHLHPEVEELVWPSDNEHINEHQKELLSDSPDDARPAKVENTNQDSSEEKTEFKSTAQNQPQHHQPVQRKIVLQSVQLPYECNLTVKPVINSFTGNFITCRVSSAENCYYLEEVDPNQGHVILCTSILSSEFLKKVSTVLSSNSNLFAIGIDISSIKSIASGVHCSPDGKACTDVSAVIDLTILTGTNTTCTITVIAGWKWGYGSGRVATLQYVLYPPKESTMIGVSSHSFVSYNPEYLCSADGLLFLGGSCYVSTDASEAVACVYIAKPHIRGSWSCSVVNRETSKVNLRALQSSTITALGVTCHPKRPFKYLAVATNLGSVSVWTYDSAMSTNRMSDNNTASQQKQLLEPLYILQGAEVLLQSEETLFDAYELDVMDACTLKSNYCTHLAWFPSTSLNSNAPLCMLAASFLNGILVYHIAPANRRKHDESELSTTSSSRHGSKSAYTNEYFEVEHLAEYKRQNLDDTSILPPFASIKASIAALKKNAENKRVEPVRTMVVWSNLGPHYPPALALCFQSNDSRRNTSYCRLVLGYLDLPVFDKFSHANAKQKASFVTLSQNSFSTLATDLSSPPSLIDSTTYPFIPVFLAGKICLLFPSVDTLGKGQTSALSWEGDGELSLGLGGLHFSDPYFSAHFRPVSSTSLGGLDSFGMPLKGEQSNFWISTQLLSCRVHEAGDPDLPASKFYWSPPMQRHWLCCTSYDREWEDTDVNPLGGTTTSVVCDLMFTNSSARLIPRRLCVDNSSSVAIVLYCPMIRGMENVNADPIAYTLIPLENKKRLLGPPELHHGRDVAFFPNKLNDVIHDLLKIIVLGNDGYSLSTLSKRTDPTKGCNLWREDKNVKLDIRDNRTSDSYVEIRRIFILSETNKLAFMGTSARDGLCCLIIEKNFTFDSNSTDFFLTEKLPFEDSSILWLQKGEEIITLISLPKDNSLKPLVAVSTQLRVLLVDHSLLIVSQISASVSCDALIPLGSRCVCFCSSIGFHVPSSQIRYLSCLDKPYTTGSISTLERPIKHGSLPLFLSMFPDRFHYLESINSDSVCEFSDERHFLAPIAVTKPALLLEPLVANALCLCDNPLLCAIDSDVVQGTLRSVIERFGRRLSNVPHGECQGIGIQGTGITAHLYQMLSDHQCIDAASSMLTIKKAHGAVFPRWIPVWIKAKNSSSVDELKQVLMHGNRYLSEYVSDPGNSMSVSLLDSYDPSSFLCHIHGIDAVINGKRFDAVQLLDLAGNEQSEQLITCFLLFSELYSTSEAKPMHLLAGEGTIKVTEPTECKSMCSAIAATFLELKDCLGNEKRTVDSASNNHDFSASRWTFYLSPLVQESRWSRRIRRSLLSEYKNHLDLSKDRPQKEVWSIPVVDAKNVWCKGPLGKKEELLLLDGIEDWLGRCRPAILGKEGAAAAKESGVTVLSGILAAAAASEETCLQHIDTASSNGWCAGIGEGRSDEENLAAYFRFSEGGDEDRRWLQEGVQDLSPNKHRGIILGTNIVTLEATTTSVDEGEEGKVSVLYDLVYTNQKHQNSAAGLAVEVKRGSSLDVGILHSHEHEPRQRCSLEFWFHCPNKELLLDEIILVRRSIAPSTSRLAYCCATMTDGLLWELVLLPSGHLQFRTCSDSLLSTTELDKKISEDSSHGSDESVNYGASVGRGMVSFQRWNHVCLILSCRGLPSVTEVSARIVMKGKTASRSVVSLASPWIPNPEDLNECLKETGLCFGLNGVAGFRMTEIRVWNCDRSDSDIRASMYEYLSAAESRPKFKVKIRSLDRKARRLPSVTPLVAIAPRLARTSVALPSVETSPAKEIIPVNAEVRDEWKMEGISRGNLKASLYESDAGLISDPGTLRLVDNKGLETGNTLDSPLSSSGKSTAVEIVPLPLDDRDALHNKIHEKRALQTSQSEGFEDSKKDKLDEDNDDNSCQSLFLEESKLLSEEMRKSIAAAVIRGPPAARHFGGNRGAVHSTKKSGIPSISICGTDKTVLYTVGQKTALKTYAISASGAITSDAVNSSASQYLCCFLAKEKKLIVYDLKNKIMLVELSMTTKLNFWRSLPEEAHGNTVVFSLITPLGGFHWLPLDVDPSPRLIWRRSPELQNKRILMYEEGGSNGLDGTLSRTTLALALVCSSEAELGTGIEAWGISLITSVPPTSFGQNVVSAAFCKPPNFGRKRRAFLPWLYLLCQEYDEEGVGTRIILKVESLSQGLNNNEPALKRLIKSQIDVNVEECELKKNLPEPSLSMGLAPVAFILSLEDAVVVLFRKQGLVFAYALESGELTLIGRKNVGHFIVDATLAAGELKGEIEIVMLLCSPSNSRDGRISVCQVSRYGCVL